MKIEKRFMWPPKSFLSFYSGQKLILESRDRRLDLSDSLMSSRAWGRAGVGSCGRGVACGRGVGSSYVA
jgi:hypothetical protein